MRDNITLSTLHSDSKTDITSISLFCVKEFSMPLQLVEEIAVGAPYKTCSHILKYCSLYPLDPTQSLDAARLLEHFIIKVFEIYRRDWCCFSAMPDVLAKLAPYLQGCDTCPVNPWAAKLVKEEAGVFVHKDTYFWMFLFRCCDFSGLPPTLSSDLRSVSRNFETMLMLPLTAASPY